MHLYYIFEFKIKKINYSGGGICFLLFDKDDILHCLIGTVKDNTGVSRWSEIILPQASDVFVQLNPQFIGLSLGQIWKNMYLKNFLK